METTANMKTGMAMDGAMADMDTTKAFTIVTGMATVMAEIITVINGMVTSGVMGMASGTRGMGRSFIMVGTTITRAIDTVIVTTTTTANIVTTSIATTRMITIIRSCQPL